MTRTARDVLDQEFLSIRAKILEVAAFYDRLNYAHSKSADASQKGAELSGGASNKPCQIQLDPLQQGRLDLLHQGCSILTDDQQDKAARLQLLFSRNYHAGWRDEYGL